MESAITDYTDYCLLCGAKREAWHHCIPGNANRAKSDKYKLVIPLCHLCHTLCDNSVHMNPKLGLAVKIIGQLAAERQWVSEGMTLEEARDKWRKEFGKSFI